jgi:beta-lactamase superfamily II metal-dependent hydrolase
MDLSALKKYWRDTLYSVVIIALVAVQPLMYMQIQTAAKTAQLQVAFFDVGQGDSFLVSTPDGYNLLVDSGESPDVVSLLQEQLEGEELSAILVTHPHEDHLGMMAEVIEEFNPDVGFINQFPVDSKSYLETVRALQLVQASRVELQQGEAIRLGCCAVLEILWPTTEALVALSDPNLWSTTFRLRYGDFSMTAGGDLYKEQEDEITKKLLIPGGQVVKINHHGSNTSSGQEFIRSHRGGIGVIQVGSNSYGHPAAATLDELEQNSLTVYNNLEHGNIYLQTDGFNYSIDTAK